MFHDSWSIDGQWRYPEISKEAASSEEQRRCPWCWELIERSATRCGHCGKDVHPLRGSASAEVEAPVPAPDEPGEKVGGGQAARPEQTPAVPVDLDSPSGIALWWVTAILVYAILLFGVAVAVPFPPAGLGVGMLAAEIVAAYLINRALWRRAREWSIARVRKMVIYLAAAVVVLIALGWIRRRFIG